MHPVEAKEEDTNEQLPHTPCISGSYPLKAEYVQQPPDDLRKSNFFNFMIDFRGLNNEPVDIVEAKFVGYMNESHPMDLRNGMLYMVSFKYPNGTKECREIFLTLLDAVTQEPIPYEGQDDNPKMQRVLLNHETICSRCSQHKSCGNKNEAPSDPLRIGKGTLKFFLKCNQNCLKGAGNPKDMRRFSIAVSFTDITKDINSIAAMSTKIFVHNNSKHSRKRKRAPSVASSLPNGIFEMFPKAGTHGTAVNVFGTNFSPGMQVYMGNYVVQAQMLSGHLINFVVPALQPSVYPVCLRLENEKIDVGTFHCEYPEYQSKVISIHPKVGVRGEDILILGQHLAKQDVKVFCNGQDLPTKVLDCSGLISVLPRNAIVGVANIVVQDEFRQLLCFSYQIEDRSHPGFSPKQGYLTVYSAVQVQSQAYNADDHYNENRCAYTPGDYYNSSSPTSSSSNSNSSAASYWYAAPFHEAGQKVKEARDYRYDVQPIRQHSQAAVQRTTAAVKQIADMIRSSSEFPYYNGSRPEITMN